MREEKSEDITEYNALKLGGQNRLKKPEQTPNELGIS